MKPRLFLIAAFLCLFAPMIQGASTPSPALLVLSKRDRTLAIVDPSTLRVVARVASGPDPHEVVAAADGKLAFISNYGFGAYHTLSVADLVTQKALPPVDLSPLRGPHGLDFAGGKVYFTAEVNKVIGSYDPATHKVDWILGTGQNRTHMVLVNAALDRIFTSNVNSGTLSIIEKTAGSAGFPPRPPGAPSQAAQPGAPPPRAGGPPQADWDETVIETGAGTEGFDVSPDGKELWSAAAESGTLSIIDVAARKRVETLPANVQGANRLKFTPDGKLVFVSSLRGAGGGDLAVFDAHTRREIKRLSLGHGAAGIVMQPDGRRAYVSSSPDDYVNVIDLKTLEVVGRIDAGREPDGLAWAVRQ